MGPLTANQPSFPYAPHCPQVPPTPVNKDDFALVQRPGPGLSQESARRYGELTKLLRQQHEVKGGTPCPGHHKGMAPAPSPHCLLLPQMCLNHSKQFTHLGNIAETSK